MQTSARSRLQSLRSLVGNMPRPWKRGVLVVFDFVVLFASVWLAFQIRLGFGYSASLIQYGLMAVAPIVAIPIFIRLGLYRAVLRYLPDRAFWTIALAVMIAAICWIAVIFLVELSGSKGAPRAVPIIYWLVGTAMTAGSRFAIKVVMTGSLGLSETGRHALVYGAGRAGTQLVTALRAGGDNSIAGFVDDNPKLWGSDVAGLRVFSAKSLPAIIEDLKITDIILCVPSASVERRLAVAGELAGLPVKLRTLPSITELATGKYTISHLREIDVEDLLGRTSVMPDIGLLSSVITGKNILVTGAGGSIGSELCRLVCQHAPKSIILVDSSESALYEIDKQLRAMSPEIKIEPILASVADRTRMRLLFEERPVDAVFHAAAYKHVAMLEMNPIEGIRNNVFGTENLAEIAYRAGISKFVLISTDKAVFPSSVMGATKRWSELIVRQLADNAERAKTGQKFLIVRFGNVLGSAGSVVPLFKEQIARGGPITLTDNRMTRYFMAIPEAAQLIVQAAALSEGGETFLLDMGEPVSISALAENMIRLAGLAVKSEDNPSDGIAIEVIGIRPGEKLHESLYYDPKLAVPTAHPKITKAQRSSVAMQDMRENIARLKLAMDESDPSEATKILFQVVELRSDLPGSAKHAVSN